MYSPAHALQSIALILMEFSGNLAQQVAGYIDPNTMHHVFTFLGPLLVFFAAAASVIISVVFFLRHHLTAWFRKASCVKLIAVWLVLVLVLATFFMVIYKLILHPTPK